MNAVLAIIADGGRAIIVIDREGEEKIIFSFSLLILLKPFDDGLVQPLPRRLPGVGYTCPLICHDDSCTRVELHTKHYQNEPADALLNHGP